MAALVSNGHLLCNWASVLPKAEEAGMSVAFGHFDGVHCGHQAILAHKPEKKYISSRLPAKQCLPLTKSVMP